MARHQQLVPVVGIIAAGVVVLLCVVQVYQSRNGEIVALSAPQALVDLQPLPAEESLKPIDFHKNKRAIVHSSTRFSACVDSAATVDEGVWCMGQLLTMLPRPLEKRALEVAKEVYPSKTVQGDPKILALKLETCLTHASERDGAVFCVADLLSHVPPAVLNKAVELGEEHPAFDWEDGHAAAVHDAAVFNTCVDTAGNVGEGVSCLGSLLTELPEALVERSVRITSELPPPHQPAEEPQMLSKDFVYCLQIAEKRDAAQYCLAHFLGRLPDEQVFSLALALALALSFSLSLFLSLIVSLALHVSQLLYFSFSFSLPLPLPLPLSLSLSLALFLTLFLSLALSDRLSRSLNHTHTHSLSIYLSISPNKYIHTCKHMIKHRIGTLHLCYGNTGLYFFPFCSPHFFPFFSPHFFGRKYIPCISVMKMQGCCLFFFFFEGNIE